MAGPRRSLAVFCASWVVGFWFSLLLFGAWNELDLMACGAISLAAATALAVTARLAPLRYVVRLRWLAGAAPVPHRTVVDFGILTRELVRALATGEPRQGVFRAKPFDAGAPTGPVSSGWRAFIGAAAGYTPNAYVVEIDPERQQVLVHDLVPSEGSEAPA
ncbi:MAG: hypothetical protein ACRDM1_00665 [Gaiellaceae bacterium]